MLTCLLCTAGAGATQASVYFTNRTSGAYTSLSFDASVGTSLVGNCAEWIVEAPTVDGAQSAMADYGEVFFSVCDAFTAGGSTVEGGTRNNINMDDGSGDEVSAGTLVASTVIQMQVRWGAVCVSSGPLVSRA